MESTPDAGDHAPAEVVATLPAPSPAAGSAAAATTTDGQTETTLPKTVRSVKRTVVNVAETVGSTNLSAVWMFFQRFDKPLSNGKNTRCIVASEQGKECGRMYKHVSKNGTRPLLDHLQKQHPQQYKVAMEGSNRSSKAKEEKGKAYAAASRGQCECGVA